MEWWIETEWAREDRTGGVPWVVVGEAIEDEIEWRLRQQIGDVDEVGRCLLRAGLKASRRGGGNEGHVGSPGSRFAAPEWSRPAGATTGIGRRSHSSTAGSCRAECPSIAPSRCHLGARNRNQLCLLTVGSTCA